MSSIMPPRPKRASRPVIVKSVIAVDARAAVAARTSVLTIVAFAPPWPRLSVPLRLHRRRVRASSSVLDLDRAAVGRGRRPELDLNVPW